MVKVFAGETNSHQKGYSIGSHSHNYFEIVYYISGKGTIEIDKTTFSFSQNTFSITKPNHVHKEESPYPTTLIYVGFISDDSIDLSKLDDGVYQCSKNSYLLSTMKEIVQELQTKDFYYHDQLELLTKSLIIQIKRSIAQSAQKADEFEKIKQYIKENCTKGINAITLAKQFNYNYDYFRKEFKRYYRISISDLILQEQVNFATNLIRTSKMKINEIAKISGFSSTSHFISCFKKQHGITPKKYIIKDLKI